MRGPANAKSRPSHRPAVVLLAAAAALQGAPAAYACQDFTVVPFYAVDPVLWRITDSQTGAACVLMLEPVKPPEIRAPKPERPTERCGLPGLEGVAKQEQTFADGLERVFLRDGAGAARLTFTRRYPEDALSAAGPNGHVWTMVEAERASPKVEMEGDWQITWREGNRGGMCMIALTSDSAGVKGAVEMDACTPRGVKWTGWERREGRLLMRSATGAAQPFTGHPTADYDLADKGPMAINLRAERMFSRCGPAPAPADRIRAFDWLVFDGPPLSPGPAAK